LRRGFHYDFLDLLFHQPLRQQAQMFWAAAIMPSLKLVLAIDFNVAYDHGQQLFMYVNSRYLIGIGFLLAGAESMP
jgi:hypothetical protein